MRGEGAAAIALSVGTLAGFFLVPRFGPLASDPRWQGGLIALAGAIPLARLVTAHELTDLGPLHLVMLAGMRNVVGVAAVFSRDRRQRRRCVLVGLVTVVLAFSFSGTAIVLGVTLGYLVALVYWFACNDAERWVDGDASDGKLALLRATVVPGVLALSSFLGALLVSPADLAWEEPLLDTGGGGGEGLTMEEVEQLIIERQEDLEEITQNARGAEADNARGGAESGEREETKTPGVFSMARSSPNASRAGNRQVFRVDGVSAAHLPMMTYDRFDGGSWFPGFARSLASTQLTAEGAWRKEVQQKALELGGRTLASGAEAEDFVEQAKTALQDWMAGASGDALEVALKAHRKTDLRRMGLGAALAGADFEHLLNPYDLEAFANDALLNPEIRDRLLQQMRDPDAEHGDRLLRTLLGWRRQRGGGALPPELAALLRVWTRGARSPIEAAQAIVRGLRDHAEYDPDATLPPGVTDGVKHFLLESRRGPDYLFASSAVVLLRAKGLPSRLVSGFVARPERYNPFSGETPVYEDDLHFWAQVRIGPRLWVDLEPTPGFELRSTSPDPPGLATLMASRIGLQSPAGQASWAIVAVAVTFLGIFRRHAAVLSAWCVWRLTGLSRPGPGRVRAAGRLVDRRVTATRGPRPKHAGRVAWLAEQFAGDPETHAALCRYQRISDLEAFHPHGLDGCDPQAIESAARGLVSTVTLGRLRRPLPSPAPPLC